MSLQIINLQTELNYLDSVSNFQIFSDLTWPHPSTHPPTKLYTHPWVGESPQISNLQTIEISQLVQVLLNFEWFRGSPLGSGGLGGWGWGLVRGCTPPMCTCTHVWHHRESPGFPQIQWGRPFAWNYHVYHACMCVHACACTCVGAPPPPSTHPQEPQEAKTPKFGNSWTNQDNSILFEDSLPLNIPQLI